MNYFSNFPTPFTSKVMTTQIVFYTTIEKNGTNFDGSTLFFVSQKVGKAIQLNQQLGPEGLKVVLYSGTLYSSA